MSRVGMHDGINEAAALAGELPARAIALAGQHDVWPAFSPQHNRERDPVAVTSAPLRGLVEDRQVEHTHRVVGQFRLGQRSSDTASLPATSHRWIAASLRECITI